MDLGLFDSRTQLLAQKINRFINYKIVHDTIPISHTKECCFTNPSFSWETKILSSYPRELFKRLLGASRD